MFIFFSVAEFGVVAEDGDSVFAEREGMTEDEELDLWLASGFWNIAAKAMVLGVLDVLFPLPSFDDFIFPFRMAIDDFDLFDMDANPFLDCVFRKSGAVGAFIAFDLDFALVCLVLAVATI